MLIKWNAETVFWHALTLGNGFSIKILFILSFQIWSKYNTEMPHTGKEVNVIYCSLLLRDILRDRQYSV